MKTLAIVSVLIIVAIVAIVGIGFQGMFITSNNDLLCNEPYIQVGSDCCIDDNDNSICDDDDLTIRQNSFQEEFIKSCEQNTEHVPIEQIIGIIEEYLTNTPDLEGSEINIKNVKEQSGLYRIVMDIDGREFTSFVTFDGKLLFPTGLDLTKETDVPTQTEPSCLNANTFIQGGIWTPLSDEQGRLKLVVYNNGALPLEFLVILTYEDGTKHPDSLIETYDDTFSLEAGEIKTFMLTRIWNDLQEVTIQSQECVEVQDMLQREHIVGI
ncbi:MAG: hypothetical protein ABIF08_03555 [Nanoarchaeota archaeon]